MELIDLDFSAPISSNDVTQEEWDDIIDEITQGEQRTINLANALQARGFSRVIQDIRISESALYRLHLHRCVFENLEFRNVNFRRYTGSSRISMKNVTFRGCQFKLIDWNKNVKMEQVEFIDCKMRALFDKVVMDRVTFRKCSLEDNTFYQCSLKNVSMIKSDLTSANFFGSTSEKLQIVASKLKLASFLGIHLDKSLIKRCDLTDVLLCSAPFRLEECTDNIITKPVVALGWDFRGNFTDEGRVSPTLVRVAKMYDAICLKFPLYLSASHELREEVNQKMENLRNVRVSRLYTVLYDTPPTPEMEKIKKLAIEIMKMADGVILPGGADIPRAFYLDQQINSSCYSLYRTLMEGAMIFEAIRFNKVVMGICRGLQIINVAMGGTLKGAPDGGIRYFNILNNEAGTYFEEKVGGRIAGWSCHEQGVDRLGSNLQVALEYRGIVKAIINHSRTIFGTQFHPEEAFPFQNEMTQNNKKIFDLFFDKMSELKNTLTAAA